MRLTHRMLGCAGIGLTIASWWWEPPAPTADLALLLGLCALGGMLPLKMPALQPLPVSLPLVGAAAVSEQPAVAMAAGCLAGLCTIFTYRRGEAEAVAAGRWQGTEAALGLSGALALAAGMVASGYGRFGLTPLPPVSSQAPPAPEILRSLLFASVIVWLAWWVVRPFDGTGTWAVALRGLLAATAASCAAWGLAAAMAGRREAVTMGLCCAGLAAFLLCRRAVRLERELAAQAQRTHTGLALLESIALAIEAKDHTSERHLRRMRVYCLELGRRLGMPADELEALEYASLLHDIGKLIVPESILSKPAGLSSEEYQVMSSHAKVGAEILESTGLSSKVAEMVRHHHERYDGTGYPGGLTGLEIPMGARILAAVDTFEALTSERPHRHGVPLDRAVAYLRDNAGKLFDPRVVGELVAGHREIEALVDGQDAGRAGSGHRSAVDTLRIRRPLQSVLDRIASSHMEVYSLHEISQALGQTLDLEESFRLIAGKLQRLVHFSACAVYVVDTEHEVLWARFATGAGAARILSVKIPVGQKVTGWAAAQRRAVAFAPARTVPAGQAEHGPCPDLEEVSADPDIALLACCVSAPLAIDEGLVGAITLYDEADRPYGPEAEQLLALVARQVAGAVRAGLLFEQTQEHALTDSLTGLPNSRFMFIAFDQEAARARQEGAPLSLMVMDIDRFREVNDGFGHHAGDRFLVGMAKAIRAQMRVCDTCIRYAGDEFVAILPRMDAREVEAVAERLAEAARDYCLEARPGRPVRLTLSIGFATMPVDGNDFETLMGMATARMKQRKQKRPVRAELEAGDPLLRGPAGGGRRPS
ncbi:MAG TPA: HD domain-containing phosphohydrolase [Candidatus Polarisedimenticolia bacterium]|nr:HD domain-containing phosphohydrolase [Candidatus Polarisedimenticolia bacterium]